MTTVNGVQACASINVCEDNIQPQNKDRLLQVVAYQALIARYSGADIVAVGNSAIYEAGYRAIEKVRDVLGDGFPIMADMFAQDGCELYLPLDKEFGADMATICASNNPGGMMAGVDAKRKCGIKPIASLYSCPVELLVDRAIEAEKLGADIIMLHLGHDEQEMSIWPCRRESDYVKEVSDAISLPLYVKCSSKTEAESAIRSGASCIIFDMPSHYSVDAFNEVKDFVDYIHCLNKQSIR